jgi:hypothetical protein
VSQDALRGQLLARVVVKVVVLPVRLLVDEAALVAQERVDQHESVEHRGLASGPSAPSGPSSFEATSRTSLPLACGRASSPGTGTRESESRVPVGRPIESNALRVVELLRVVVGGGPRQE